MSYINPAPNRITTSPQLKSISLKNQVVLGRDDTATLPLPAPTVSRHHATIETDGRGRYMVYDHSTNGTFINGQRVVGSAVLPDGATIRIGPFTLVRYGDRLTLIDSGEQIRLEARGLVIQHRGKRRLDDVTLAIEPGQLVALVGGSGAGKSTLLRTLLGTEPLNQGVVYLNGDDLRQNFNVYRNQIGYVPQDDITH